MTTERITGTIRSAITPGWWMVIDKAGRKHRAASAEQWRRGDRVVILSGQIVGLAEPDKKPVVRRV